MLRAMEIFILSERQKYMIVKLQSTYRNIEISNAESLIAYRAYRDQKIREKLANKKIQAFIPKWKNSIS